jgi:predicted small lipoprotein YifL
MSPTLRAAYTCSFSPSDMNPMRPLPLLAALLALAILAGCGTKTPLKLPPPAPGAEKTAESGRWA